MVDLGDYCVVVNGLEVDVYINLENAKAHVDMARRQGFSAYVWFFDKEREFGDVVY